MYRADGVEAWRMGGTKGPKVSKGARTDQEDQQDLLEFICLINSVKFNVLWLCLKIVPQKDPLQERRWKSLFRTKPSTGPVLGQEHTCFENYTGNLSDNITLWELSGNWGNEFNYTCYIYTYIIRYVSSFPTKRPASSPTDDFNKMILHINQRQKFGTGYRYPTDVRQRTIFAAGRLFAAAVLCPSSDVHRNSCHL